ncbi:unnamed protein product [Effrenium voratum]|nr:unnamed protein product [Effrenium voratum]
MAHVTNLFLDIEPVTHGTWRRRMLHGSPAASAMGSGGRKEWYRRQLQRTSGTEASLWHSASEPTLRRSKGASKGPPGTLPPLPQMSPKQFSKTSSRVRLPSYDSDSTDQDLISNPGGQMQDGEMESRSPSRISPHGVQEEIAPELAVQENLSPRSLWSSALEKALEESDVQLLFRLDLPLMVKAVAEGELTNFSEVAPPRWHQLKAAAQQLIQELTQSGTGRPGQLHSLQAVTDLYDFLEKQGCMQGFDALCKSFLFLFGTLEQVQKVLDMNRSGIFSITEFSMAMSLIGLDLQVICGLDESQIFRAVDQDHDGTVNIQQLLKFCSSKPEPEEKAKASKNKKKKNGSPRKAQSKQPTISTTAIIEKAGLKALQEKTIDGVHFYALALSKPAGPTTPSVQAGVGMHATVDEFEEEEIDEVIATLSKQELQRAQAKWICISKWLASLLGAAAMEEGAGAKTWEDERQQAYDAVDQVPLVPMAPALPRKEPKVPEEEPTGADPSLRQAGKDLDEQMEKLFLEEASEQEAGTKLIDRVATRKFFEDLMLADYGWHKELRMVILDRLYDDTLNIQKEEDKLSKGLHFRSLKVVLHRMLRDRAEGYIEKFRLNVERRLKQSSKEAARLGARK